MQQRSVLSGQDLAQVVMASSVNALLSRIGFKKPVTLAIKYTTDPGLFPGEGSGRGAAAGTYVKRQKLGSLEVEYDQYQGTTVTSCDNCNDPKIITAFPWLKDLLGCWIGGGGAVGGVGLMLRVRS